MLNNSLENCRDFDIRNVNAKELVDINDVKIAGCLSCGDRLENYVRQIKNPYCYKHNGMIIKLSFSGKNTLSDAVKNYILTSDVSVQPEDSNKIASA